MAFKKVRTVSFTIRELGRLVIRVNMTIPDMTVNRPKCVQYYSSLARKLMRYKPVCLWSFLQELHPTKFPRDATKLTLINAIFNKGLEDEFFKSFKFEYPGKVDGNRFLPGRDYLEITTGSPEGNM